MLNKEEVQRIAALARLELSEKELEKYRKELSSILDYIEKLEEVSVKGVEPTSHPGGLKNIFREDEEKGKDEERARGMIESAPGEKDGYVKVKSILKRSK
ncbi:MAG: Asp-tRNA(Asn)/Glu-tRNA(Gln) amidotransferase subunit GatC [Candidatus Paceibacterota bacterium]|jgi:aspartyl-tRNA(Asn)/glutamyl-tRNA(Gln) amidotransferase subunit C|nr:Asp-tRNA(Asn)/Glu-tRNA(Gln) amidotransferase subunit GatC [Candidatus Paceibacterota bacterium]